MWRAHPVVGSGLGSFAKDYSQMLSAGELKKTRVVISHNAPVTVLSEEGAVGFALLAWLSVLAVIVGIRATRDRDEDIGVPGAMMLAGVVGIFVHALLYSALIEDPYTWVLLSGLVVLATFPRGDLLPEPGTAEAP
jgi:O-antigen ligase